MNISATETSILESAIDAFQRQTGIKPKVLSAQPRGSSNRQADAVLSIDGQRYEVEVKRWAQHSDFGALISQVKQLQNGILVADYVNPMMADRLRQQGVRFIDTAGNAFIETKRRQILLKGNPRSAGTIATPQRQRIFSAAGLKVTFALLRDPHIAHKPYRDIARSAGVALGTVGTVMTDLQSAGYLALRANQRRLTRQRNLFERWVEHYLQTLRPKLVIGHFVADDSMWWKQFDLSPFQACWGGEPAASTYLRPVVATVYVPKNQYIKLIAAAHLRKAVDARAAGNVEIVELFWKDNDERAIADPILVYADLVASRDPRNQEAAKQLYDDRIVGRLEDN